jgi:regulator of sigma E protease
MISLDGILSFLVSAAGFVFIFGIVVLVHEAGHFLAAKITGVYAPRFSVGFGPGPKKRWGETQYQIGVIPLGGYVRMASREDEATAFLEGGSETDAELRAQAEETRPRDWDPEAMIPFGPKPVPADRWFESKSLPKRLLIMLAGVSMNAVLTVVVLFGLILQRGVTILESRVVGSVKPAPAIPELASQLLPGDTILSIQGTPVRNWNDIQEQIVLAGGDTLRIETNRGTVSIPAGAPASRARETLVSSIVWSSRPVVRNVTPGDPASRAGMQPGDSIMAVDGTPVTSFSQVIEKVNASPGTQLVLTVRRGGETLDLRVTPELRTVVDQFTGQQVQAGLIGVERVADSVTHDRVGAPSAMALAVKQTGQMAGAVVTTLKGLIERKVSLKELGGPIQIARASGEAAQQGVVPLLYLLALLSINLAVLNLLPIPVLDGGQVLILIAESVKGSPFSPKARQLILGTGVALVLLLMLVVSYNDVLRLFGN